MIRTLIQLRSLSRAPSLVLSPQVRARSDLLLQIQTCSALRFSTTIRPTFGSQKPAESELQDFMARHEISVSDQTAPAPCLSFEQAGLPDYLVTRLEKEFTAPTPIQAQALPIAMSGKNMVGIGQTGSGKTLAFLLPAFLHIQNERERLGQTSGRSASGPKVLVLAPTRELAKQIEEVALKYRRITNIKTVCCIGGEGRTRQLNQYDSGAELMIATPGRINDFLENGDMKVDKVGFMVLDEADRMLDMGFEPQVRSVLDAVGDERQTMMFSATWPDEVQDLASEFLGDYTFMKIGSVDLCANRNIEQQVEVTTTDYKQEQFLIDITEKMKGKKVLVFTERKTTVDRLERLLRNRRIRAMGIHGDKSHRMRGETLQRFKDGSCNVMIATDVAARGLDINDIEWVVNFDFPLDIENYIHRIGRTGRASKKGSSLTYITLDEARFAGKLKKILIESDQNVPEALEDLEKEAHRAKVTKGKLGKAMEESRRKHRNYGYRGMGRDDGEETEEYSWSRNNYRRNSGSGYNRRSNHSDYRRNTDKHGYDY